MEQQRPSDHFSSHVRSLRRKMYWKILNYLCCLMSLETELLSAQLTYVLTITRIYWNEVSHCTVERAWFWETGSPGFASSLHCLLDDLESLWLLPCDMGMIAMSMLGWGEDRAQSRHSRKMLVSFSFLCSEPHVNSERTCRKLPLQGNLASVGNVMPAYLSLGLRKVETSLASSAARWVHWCNGSGRRPSFAWPCAWASWVKIEETGGLAGEVQRPAAILSLQFRVCLLCSGDA